MPATRGHTAAVAANVAANSNNIAESIVPQIRPGGAPARAYLNEKVVPYLLDGMKGLAKDQWVSSRSHFYGNPWLTR